MSWVFLCIGPIGPGIRRSSRAGVADPHRELDEIALEFISIIPAAVRRVTHRGHQHRTRSRSTWAVVHNRRRRQHHLFHLPKQQQPLASSNALTFRDTRYVNAPLCNLLTRPNSCTSLPKLMASHFCHEIQNSDIGTMLWAHTGRIVP